MFGLHSPSPPDRISLLGKSRSGPNRVGFMATALPTWSADADCLWGFSLDHIQELFSLRAFCDGLPSDDRILAHGW